MILNLNKKEIRLRIVRLLIFNSVYYICNRFCAEAYPRRHTPVNLGTGDISRHAAEFRHHLTIHLYHSPVPVYRTLPPISIVKSRHDFLLAKNITKIVAATA